MQRYPAISLILLALLLRAATVAAQSVPPGVNILAHQWTGFGGEYAKLDLCTSRSHIAYLGLHDSIILLDLTDPASPHVADTMGAGVGEIESFTISEDTALVVVGSDRLAIYSIADPARPVPLYTQIVTGLASADYARGRLYISANTPERSGVSTVVDVADWKHPRVIGSLASVMPFGTIRVVGGLLFLQESNTDDVSLLIYRTSDSGRPEFLREWSPPSDFVRGLQMTDSIGIFAGSGLAGPSVVTFSVAGDGTISLLRYYLADGPIQPHAIALSGRNLLVAATISSRFETLPSTALLRGRLNDDGSIVFTDTLILGINRGEDLSPIARVPITLSDSTFTLLTTSSIITGVAGADGAIEPAGRLAAPGLCLDLAASGRIVHALTNREIVTLDFARPDRPDTLSRFPFVAERIAMAGTGRVLAADSILTLIDMDDPRNPRVLASLPLGRNTIATRVRVTQATAVVVIPDQRIELVALLGDSLRRIGVLGLPAADAVLRGDTLFVAGLDSSVTLWDVSVPADPRQLPPVLRMRRPFLAVTLIGDTLAASTDFATYFYPIARLGIGDSTLQTRPATHTVLAGRLLFYTVPGGNLEVGDFTSEYASRIVGEVGAPGDGNVHLDGTLLAVSAGYVGLRIFLVDSAIAGVSDPAGAGRRGTNMRLVCAPNPSRGRTTIRYETSEYGRTRITIEDLLGREHLLLSDRVEASGSHTLPIVVELPDGFYFVRVETAAEAAATAPLIIQQ